MKTIKRKPNLNGLATLRKKLGFSQELLAIYLSVHPSTIKLAELGKRKLPTPALIKVANMEITLAAKTKANEYQHIHPAEQPLLEVFKKKYDLLFERETNCRLLSHNLQKKLNQQMIRYQMIREKLQIIETAVQENEGDQLATQTWQTQQQFAIAIQNKCGLASQHLLKTRILILNAGAALYSNMKAHLMKDLPPFFTGNNNTEI